jgi:hypothetical protein
MDRHDQKENSSHAQTLTCQGSDTATGGHPHHCRLTRRTWRTVRTGGGHSPALFHLLPVLLRSQPLERDGLTLETGTEGRG